VIVEVDSNSPTPPYEQIRSQVATMIAAGTLPTGAQLPPIRQLAADLGLAANTVARAYRELEVEGLVHSRVRHGTVVAPIRGPLDPGEVRRRLADAAAAYATAARQLGVGADEARHAADAALAQANAATPPDLAAAPPAAHPATPPDLPAPPAAAPPAAAPPAAHPAAPPRRS
jgi:DNA-binding transcriptional regulator YhcF (GntR family)